MNLLSDKGRRVQYACLIAVLLMEVLLLLFEDRKGGIVWYILEQYMAIPAMIFLGTALCSRQTRQTKMMLLLGGAVIAWYIVVQIIHQTMGMNKAEVGTVACVYALALPFCNVSADSGKQYGLRLTGMTAVGGGVLILLYGAMLMLGKLPTFLKNYVTWDGARFCAMGHPNQCAALLMIGIAFCVGFCIRSKKRWLRGLLLVLAALQFALMSLTNGRTAIMITCLMLGGMVFCALRRPGWQRLALAALAGIAVVVVLFGASQVIFRSNVDYRIGLAVQAQRTGIMDEDTPQLDGNGKLKTGSRQGTLKQNMGTLNGRTRIWQAILSRMRDDSQLRTVGTEYVDLVIQQGGRSTPAAHAHNSWMEVWCRRGIAGLILALVLTVLAVWNVAAILWYNRNLWESCIAMLMLSLLVCAMLEPYLFADGITYYFYDFVFMMCLGYMNAWRTREGER